MQQRYYDPIVGRFYSNDSVDFMGHMQRGNSAMGFNRYAYANNNPYKYTDPDGKFVNLITGAIGAYTAYNQAKDLGFSDSEALIAGGFGAVVGVLSGGVGSQAVSTVLKTAVTQVAKNTGKQAVKETVKSTAAGASAAGGTQMIADGAGDILQGQPISIDTTKAGIKAVEGGATAALATASTVGLAGRSTLTEAAEGVATVAIQETLRED